ncbi:MAG: DUF5691 domain-containing protein [bacterium]|nr:DUF5691 domain-containing protein [bacterium]
MTTADTLWDALLPAALLGTERHTLQLPPDAPQVLHGLPTTDPEARLLATAATAAMMRRSGHIPPEDTHLLPDPAPEETLPVCTPRSARRLNTLLGQTLGQGRPPSLSLLIEWMHIIRQRGKRVPYSVLPALLDLTYRQRSDVDFVRLVSEVMGERGGWLAQTNMRFEYLLHPQQPLENDSSTIQADRDAREAPILEQLQEESGAALNEAVQQLRDITYTWSDTLTTLFTERMVTLIDQAPPSIFTALHWYDVLFAAQIPPHRLEEVLARLKNMPEEKLSYLKRLIDKIEFRRDMLLELANE